MDLHEIKTEEQYVVRTTEDEVVIDLGLEIEGSVDVIENTVIVVLGDQQYELELDEPPRRVFMKNGILTIKQGDQA